MFAGAAAAEAANLLSGGRSPAPVSRQAPPDVDLTEEHGVLKRVLLIYEEAVSRLGSGGAPAGVVVAAVHDGAEVIHDFIESFHEALEEGYVFPRLRNAGVLVSTVDTLLVQHGRGRQLTQLILEGSNLSAMRSSTVRGAVSRSMSAFARMYQPHEAREDTVVFPAFRSMLDAHELEDLAATFAALQAHQFGKDAFGAVVERVANIERSLGIYDLNQFTPPATTS